MQAIYKAISVKYHGPSNRLGARVKASASVGNVTLPFNHGLSMEENAVAAVDELLRRYEWDNHSYTIGALPGGYVAVLSDKPEGE